MRKNVTLSSLILATLLEQARKVTSQIEHMLT